MSNNIQFAYEQIEKFNNIAGNLVTDYDEVLQGVDAQIDFIKEELYETEDAFGNEDSIALLDGACDVFVTACGLLQRLKVAGFNVDEALKRVCENNLTKFPSEHIAENQPKDSFVAYHNVGCVVYRRDYDGKVMKPLNYKSVDIADCVPKGFFFGDDE